MGICRICVPSGGRVCSTLIVKLHWYCSWTVSNKFFLCGESYVPKYGMYIPSLGTYIPKHETYIPKLGIYFLSLTKNIFSEAKKQFCYREKKSSLQTPAFLRDWYPLYRLFLCPTTERAMLVGINRTELLKKYYARLLLDDFLKAICLLNWILTVFCDFVDKKFAKVVIFF